MLKKSVQKYNLLYKIFQQTSRIFYHATLFLHIMISDKPNHALGKGYD